MISSWGDRIERSVFRCTLDSAALDELLQRIDATINHSSDSVHVFHQCRSCAPQARYVGQAAVPSPDPYWIL